MTQRIQLARAFVLHTRPFRDTSLLVDLLSQEHGRFTAVARGARSQRSTLRGLLQPFIPLLVSWYGKRELMTMTGAEPASRPFLFQGNSLLSAMYLNELLVRLLHQHDPDPSLFENYQLALQSLSDNNEIEMVLRRFEYQLLDSLGYGFHWDRTADDKLIESGHQYQFDPMHGFIMETGDVNNTHHFLGQHLLAIANDEWGNAIAKQTAKHVMRAAINFHMAQGGRIHSRDLFR